MVRLNEIVQGFPPQQRGVGIGHHDGSVDQAHGLDHGADRMAGTALPVLDHDLGVRGMPGEMGGDLPATLADHHDQAPWLKFPGRGHHVVEHRTAAYRMQDFRGASLHPRALARRKDDDGGRTVHTHSARLLGIAAGNRRDRPAGSRP